MDIVTEMGGLRDATRTASDCLNEAILLDITYADRKVIGHIRAGSADRDGPSSPGRRLCWALVKPVVFFFPCVSPVPRGVSPRGAVLGKRLASQNGLDL